MAGFEVTTYGRFCGDHRGKKAYRLPDGEGLFLFVASTGGRLWGYKYRHDGKQSSWRWDNIQMSPWRWRESGT